MAESKRVAFWVSKAFLRDFSPKLSTSLLFNALPHIHRRLFSAPEPRITTPGAPLGGGDGENESGLVADGGVRAAERAGKAGETAKEKLETAYDVATGRREMIKETVVAGAEENVIDTTEYRSIIEDKSSH